MQQLSSDSRVDSFTAVAGALAGKARIVVTHQLHYLARQEVDRVLVLSADGHVVACGPYQELLAQGVDCESILASHNADASTASSVEDPMSPPPMERATTDGSTATSMPNTPLPQSPLVRATSDQSATGEANGTGTAEQAGTFSREEQYAEGTVKWSSVAMYKPHPANA